MIRIHLRCHVGAAVSAPHPCAQHRKERAIKWLEGLGRRDLVVYFYLIRRPSDYVNTCTRSPKEARIINLLFYLFLSVSPPSTLGRRERTPAPLPAKATSSAAEGLPSWVLTPLTSSLRFVISFQYKTECASHSYVNFVHLSILLFVK